MTGKAKFFAIWIGGLAFTILLFTGVYYLLQ
jgi:hypothetical protein